MELVDPDLPGEPPADPEEWSAEKWITWLKATDAEALAEEGAPPVTAVGRITRTSGGQLLGQAMIGMANAIYGRNEQKIVIVSEGDSDPEPDDPCSVHLDFDHPERSVVVFRPTDEPPA